MTCKDCICSEVCYYKAFNDEKHLKKRRNDVEKICKSFAHRDKVGNAPVVDAVEVVRCKDCKEWCRNAGIVDSPNGHCFCHDIDTNQFDFCSYGERKDNGC